MLAERKLARQHIDIKIVEQQIKQQNGDLETKTTHQRGHHLQYTVKLQEPQ